MDINIPKHKLGIAMQHMVEQGKRPCFRIGGLRITIAGDYSSNPGALYIKDDNWDYIGKVTHEGVMKLNHPDKITAEQKMLVLAAIYDPEATAMSNGRVTGSCCCCGRTLTNKLSIELGIGPICRGFWFPEPTVDTSAMEKMLADVEEHIADKDESMTDSLELDLGIPYETTEEVKKAVDNLASLPVPPTAVAKLVLGYCDLMHEDQMKFLDTIQEIESNARN